MVKILAVDDDSRVLRLERRILEGEGYTVLEASDGQEALETVVAQGPDLVLLDVTMPQVDGFTACQRIREFSQVPIIVLTGQAGDDDKVKGLELGADDYVTKPFNPKELVCRVKAVLRRFSLNEGAEKGEPTFQTGELLIDFARNRVSLAGREVALSAIEYRLLGYLARNAGRIVTPDQILERVWGLDYVGEAHLLRVTIGRLRHKLGDDAREPRYIITRSGIGYSLSLNADKVA